MSDSWPQWRPIKDAPRDQTAILGIHKNNVARIMHVTWRMEIGSDDYLNPTTRRAWRPTHFVPLPRTGPEEQAV